MSSTSNSRRRGAAVLIAAVACTAMAAGHTTGTAEAASSKEQAAEFFGKVSSSQGIREIGVGGKARFQERAVREAARKINAHRGQGKRSSSEQVRRIAREFTGSKEARKRAQEAARKISARRGENPREGGVIGTAFENLVR